jgi:hypothetical protein
MTQLAQQLVMLHTLQQLGSNTSSGTRNTAASSAVAAGAVEEGSAGALDGRICSSRHTAESEDSRPEGVLQEPTAAGSQTGGAAGGTAALELLQQLLQHVLTVQGSEQSDGLAFEDAAEGQWLPAALQ